MKQPKCNNQNRGIVQKAIRKTAPDASRCRTRELGTKKMTKPRAQMKQRRWPLETEVVISDAIPSV
jgi:hypothetical protein